jgi:hypothetical protein
MFGRRKVPFGSEGNGPPPPPSGKDPFPIEKMDRALENAIRLFTRALDEAGVDAGELAIRGEVPPNVTKQLAECTTYRGEEDGGLTYLALGITPDFKAFMYPPHCRLYLIINSTGICEDPHTQSFLKTLAPAQFPGPMVDAHIMRTWIRYILPTGEALRQGAETLGNLHESMMHDMTAVVRRVPPAFAQQLDLKEIFKEWVSGFPGTIGRPLTPDVERMNGLPVTPFIAETLTRFLAELQADGIRQQYG